MSGVPIRFFSKSAGSRYIGCGAAETGPAPPKLHHLPKGHTVVGRRIAQPASACLRLRVPRSSGRAAAGSPREREFNARAGRAAGATREHLITRLLLFPLGLGLTVSRRGRARAFGLFRRGALLPTQLTHFDESTIIHVCRALPPDPRPSCSCRHVLLRFARSLDYSTVSVGPRRPRLLALARRCGMRGADATSAASQPVRCTPHRRHVPRVCTRFAATVAAMAVAYRPGTTTNASLPPTFLLQNSGKGGGGRIFVTGASLLVANFSLARMLSFAL